MTMRVTNTEVWYNSALHVRRILGKTSGAPVLRSQSMDKKTAKTSFRPQTGV
jgi:hypothetical protein